ncbi:hypothetical protein BU204_23170 [Actinophytocola xanthii]|uniref:VWFA domain-containing protein n=2 Tax=Actinophytocola xanthii TaxID=1912961 RepID=A0A1Q8CLE4_9PSEU|nr:hypothetical protein BU204_23170 [Actinophytocola xanthii]
MSVTSDLEQLNEDLGEFRRALLADPTGAASRLSVIAFSGTAEVLLPLSPVVEIAEMPLLRPGSATNFGPAFTLLRETMARDLDGLAAVERRPAVLFLSDGQPSDPASWPPTYADLAALGPVVVALAVGEAELSTLRRIGTGGVVRRRALVGPGTALVSWVRELTR